MLVRTLLLLTLSVLISRAENLRTNYVFGGEKTFAAVAKTNDPVTDKVAEHFYQKMYGKILLPMVEKFALDKKQLKFLEIGLGCDMEYGPGASVKMWKKIFDGRDIDLWEAEYDAACVDKFKKEGHLKGIRTVTGDQGDNTVLKRWITETGGKFDVIVDDGGHKNHQILNTFLALWPELNEGGNYFIEDLQVSFRPSWTTFGFPSVTKVIQAWVEALHVGPKRVSDHQKHILAQYPLPPDLDSIYCQKEACVLHKEDPVR
eukprot:gene12374-14322_t